MTKRLPLLVLATIAAGGIVLLKARKEPVRPEPEPPKPKIDYSGFIKPHTDSANNRNLNALKTFEMEVNRIIEHHKPKLRSAVSTAVQEAAGYGSCCKIVYYLAWDKVRGGNNAQDYLDTFSTQFLDPPVKAMGEELNEAVKDLNYKLRRSTLTLAADLAAPGPSAEGSRPSVPDKISHEDFDKALRNLGFDATSISISIVFEATAIGKNQLVAILRKTIRPIASRLFGKQVAKLAGSAVIAGADGPVPVGDIIAAGGVIWTSYDIYSSQKEFEAELDTSWNNSLQEGTNKMHKQAIEYASELVEQHQALQGNISLQTLETLSGADQ